MRAPRELRAVQYGRSAANQLLPMRGGGFFRGKWGGVLSGLLALWCAATCAGALFLRDGRSRSLAERDGYYRQAKVMGYRARSAFKVSGRASPWHPAQLVFSGCLALTAFPLVAVAPAA